MFMHTITLKSDDTFFNMLNSMVNRLNTTRSALIRKAVVHYKENLEKEALKEQMKRASLRVREASLKECEVWDETIKDGLENV
jgi:predicted transcriptional regulator